VGAFNNYSIAPRLIVALILGMAIGAERQIRQRHTGLNTHALVCMGAAAFTSLATLLEQGTDVRLGGQVVTGIGFLGAGLIMRDGLNVRGLAGAATVWATGAVGALAGYGHPLEALEAAIFVLLIDIASPRLTRVLDRYASESDLSERFFVIELKCDAKDEAVVRTMALQAINAQKLRLHSLESHAAGQLGQVEVEAGVYSTKDETIAIEKSVSELSLSPLIFSASWTDIESA
jgi:putative Mg2+ transporter-C (MgtC) family protein